MREGMPFFEGINKGRKECCIYEGRLEEMKEARKPYSNE
jgi:hypothetical protein